MFERLMLVAFAVGLATTATMAETSSKFDMVATSGEQFDCTTAAVSVKGADIDASEFTAESDGKGGCNLSFTKSIPVKYTASVTDGNGKTVQFKAPATKSAPMIRFGSN